MVSSSRARPQTWNLPNTHTCVITFNPHCNLGSCVPGSAPFGRLASGLREVKWPDQSHDDEGGGGSPSLLGSKPVF